jgi:hypothetical protein
MYLPSPNLGLTFWKALKAETVNRLFARNPRAAVGRFIKQRPAVIPPPRPYWGMHTTLASPQKPSVKEAIRCYGACAIAPTECQAA